MEKEFLHTADNEEVVIAYSLEVEPGHWNIHSDSETLSRVMALLHESEIMATPFFTMVDVSPDSFICDISMLDVVCSKEDLQQACYWLMERSHYKVYVRNLADVPDGTTHL